MTSLIVSLLACGHNKVKIAQKVEAGWKVLNEEAYSIQYPEKWSVDTSGQMNTNLVLMAPVVQGEPSTSINLMTLDYAGKTVDLAQLAEISENQVKSSGGDLLESKKLSSNGNDYQKIIYTKDKGDYTLKFEQYYFLVNSKEYLLTLCGDNSKYDSWKENGEKICNSFIVN